MTKILFFRVGDIVQCERFGMGKIIARDEEQDYPLLIEFENPSRGLHSGEYRGKSAHCFWVSNYGKYEEISIDLILRKLPKETNNG